MHELLSTQPATTAIDLFTLPLGAHLILEGVEYDAWKAAVAALSGNGLTRFQTIKLSIFAVSGLSVEPERIDFNDLTTGNFVVIDGKAFLASEFKALLLGNDKLRVSTIAPATIPDMTHYEYRGLPLTFENVHYEVSEALEMASWNDDENNIIDPSDPHHPFDYENNNWAIDLTEVELYLLVRDGYVMVDGPLYPVKYLIEKLRENRCNFEILHEIDQPGLSGV